MEQKVCKCCKRERDIRYFKLSENSDDGYFPYCRPCVMCLLVQQADNYDRYFQGAK